MVMNFFSRFHSLFPETPYILLALFNDGHIRWRVLGFRFPGWTSFNAVSEHKRGSFGFRCLVCHVLLAVWCCLQVDQVPPDQNRYSRHEGGLQVRGCYYSLCILDTLVCRSQPLDNYPFFTYLGAKKSTMESIMPLSSSLMPGWSCLLLVLLKVPASHFILVPCFHQYLRQVFIQFFLFAGNGGGFIKIVERLVRGVWTPTAFELLQPSLYRIF